MVCGLGAIGGEVASSCWEGFATARGVFCCGNRAGVGARSASVPQAVHVLGLPHARGGRGALGYSSAFGRTCLSAAWGIERPERDKKHACSLSPLRPCVRPCVLVPVAHHQGRACFAHRSTGNTFHLHEAPFPTPGAWENSVMAQQRKIKERIFKGLRPCSADPLYLVSVFQHGGDMVFVAMV